jgi:hypothetical protein
MGWGGFCGNRLYGRFANGQRFVSPPIGVSTPAGPSSDILPCDHLVLYTAPEFERDSAQKQAGIVGETGIPSDGRGAVVLCQTHPDAAEHTRDR